MLRLLPPLLVLLLASCGPAQSDATETDDSGPSGTITLRQGNHAVSFAPELGGRMTSYRVAGREILQTTRDAADLQWGSTVWTSPQSAWNWPPEPTFDRQAFTVVKQTATELLLRSAVDSISGLQMDKHFLFSTDSKAGLHLKARYHLSNQSNVPVARALWENTRLPYAGEFLFIADSVRRDGLEAPFAERGDNTVVKMAAGDEEKGKLFVFPRKGKATYAGNGVRLRKLWYLDRDNGVAPGQAPLELYLAPEEGFAEFEIQGPYVTIPPGESVSLLVGWQAAVLE